MKKTGRKWETKRCGRCGQSHKWYSGKLDKNGVEYVVCGVTNKRMNVSGTGKEAHSFAFPTLWEEVKVLQPEADRSDLISAKRVLYLRLLDLGPESMSPNDIDLMTTLASDVDIQDILQKNAHERSGD